MLFIAVVFFYRTAQTLFDFTRSGSDSASELWTETSDTMKGSTGMSKAALVIQKSPSFQRAVLFTLLNPKKTGNGYAAVQCETNFNLGDFNNISIRCRAQGINVHYKMILRHKARENNSLVYGQVFTVIIIVQKNCGTVFLLHVRICAILRILTLIIQAPTNEFATVKLPFGIFKPYYHGKELSVEENPLDRTAITNIGLKIDKGPYLPDNQPGVAALEIDWIKATK